MTHFAGKRFRRPTKHTKKTLAWVHARAAYAEFERAHSGLPFEASEQCIRTFSQALAEYQATYGPNYKPRAIQLAVDRAKPEKRVLGTCLLAELTDRKISE